MKDIIIIAGAATIGYLIYQQWQAQQVLQQSYNDTATLQNYIDKYWPGRVNNSGGVNP